ncbi:hypothetical protein C8R44DRAFT_339080 [Mycena epipterygia]|nr:hypothetical protein C8R44DRAFT_339080 [Mycena epipterygia]
MKSFTIFGLFCLRNPSLVSAALPDDLLIPIVLEAAQDRTTMLCLALVSKAIGRVVESMLYSAPITLCSTASVRTFTTTLRTKRRNILSLVSDLTLTLAAPRDYEDFWGLVGTWCPNIDRLSLFAADLDSVRRTKLQPHHLCISFGVNPSESLPAYNLAEEPSPSPWGRVSHLYLPDHLPTPLRSLLEQSGLQSLTHFSCSGYFSLRDPTVLQTLYLLLALPSLRLCAIRIGVPRGSLFASNVPQNFPYNDKRFVFVWSDDVDDDGPAWEFAEREIALRARKR